MKEHSYVKPSCFQSHFDFGFCNNRVSVSSVKVRIDTSILFIIQITLYQILTIVYDRIQSFKSANRTEETVPVLCVFPKPFNKRINCCEIVQPALHVKDKLDSSPLGTLSNLQEQQPMRHESYIIWTTHLIHTNSQWLTDQWLYHDSDELNFYNLTFSCICYDDIADEDELTKWPPCLFPSVQIHAEAAIC